MKCPKCGKKLEIIIIRGVKIPIYCGRFKNHNREEKEKYNKKSNSERFLDPKRMH